MTEGMTAIAGELAPTPAIETQAPETAQPEQVEVPELEQASETEGEEGAEGDQPDALEMAEIEVDGKTYKVPAELKDGYLKNGDYTRKTQEVAEMRRSAEAKIEEAAKHFQASQEFIQANAALMNVDQQLQQYQNVDWARLEQEDPMGAMSHWRQFQTLKEQRGQVAQYLEKTQAERNAKAERDIANRLHETREFAQKEIPGWSPEVDAKIVGFAEGVGFSRDQLKAAMTPQVYKILHLAWLGEQSMQKQKAAPARPQAPIKPLTTVTPKASPAGRKSVTEMSVDEMAAYLNKR